jgi:hypothetical protein
MKQVFQRFKELHVLVATPSMGLWAEPFGVAYANMLTHCATRKIGSYKNQIIRPMSMKGSVLSNLRVAALKRAKKLECTHLLWVDSDQSFPRDTLHRLIAHDKDVIGANVATKTLPTLPTARVKSVDPKGSLVWTDAEMQGLQKVWRLGCGLTLMGRKAIDALPLSCFEMIYKPEAEKYQGEDWKMCEALEEAGIEIWVDHKLSNEVGHHGWFNFTHEYNGVVQTAHDKSQAA